MLQYNISAIYKLVFSKQFLLVEEDLRFSIRPASRFREILDIFMGRNSKECKHYATYIPLYLTPNHWDLNSQSDSLVLSQSESNQNSKWAHE
jgi:hypothetical protein